MTETAAWPEVLARALAQHGTRPDALLPVLHALQDALGHVPDAAVPALAQGLQLSRADVHGVLGYYHFFRRTPPARHILQVCRAESCQACGSEALWAHAQQHLATQTSPTPPRVALEAVYCLGLCAVSPAVSMDDELQARATPAQLDRWFASLESQP